MVSDTKDDATTAADSAVEMPAALLERNCRWAQAVKRSDPQFFERLSAQQAPRFLWIGCADSRVPATEIVDLPPGEIFVHRNVANVVVHSDLNCLSVIQFAIEVLAVRHVIVCGHYGCGGVTAALEGTKLGLIDNWLRHVQDVRNRHLEELEALPTHAERVARLCELNVLAQAVNVAETTLVQDAWARGQSISVWSFVYGLRDGILREIGRVIDGPPALRAARSRSD
jgi:carbonic anhydrase